MTESGLDGRVPVDRQLELAPRAELLEATRRELKQPCTCDLRLRLRDADGDPAQLAQRSALFRRRKNPSSSSREA